MAKVMPYFGMSDIFGKIYLWRKTEEGLAVPHVLARILAKRDS